MTQQDRYDNLTPEPPERRWAGVLCIVASFLGGVAIVVLLVAGIYYLLTWLAR